MRNEQNHVFPNENTFYKKENQEEDVDKA